MHKESRSGSMTTEAGEDIGESIEDARKLVRELREKTRSQAQQLLAWKRAYKMQEVLISRLNREKSDQLKTLSAKLLLFESRLIRKQKDISVMLSHREVIIHRQQRIIETLTNRLIDNGLEPPVSDLTELDTNFLDLESLNDSDSAVVMEELDSDINMVHMPRFRNSGDGITVVRSISDAIDPNLKYTIRRCNGFLRRPEILETVYSVEEDGDNEQQGEGKSEVNKKRDAFASGSGKAIVAEDVQRDRDMQETVCSVSSVWKEKVGEGETRNNNSQVTTYNRVMSNHRSVTKPKDVKYKRINKAKSKSLEELRGRLKNWVEQGSKMSMEHSHSYA